MDGIDKNNIETINFKTPNNLSHKSLYLYEHFSLL